MKEEIDTEAQSGSALAEEQAVRRVFLIRHGDASEGERDQDLGHHLSELGVRQAEALAHRASHWQLDAIYTSDKYRAYETACAIRKHHPNAAWFVDSIFRELDWRSLEGGLSEMLAARLEAVWGKIVDSPYATSAFVIHGGLIKYLIGRAVKFQGGLKPRFPSAHTGITALAVRPGGLVHPKFFNDTSHLTPDLAVGPKRPWIEDPVTKRWLF